MTVHCKTGKRQFLSVMRYKKSVFKKYFKETKNIKSAREAVYKRFAEIHGDRMCEKLCVNLPKFENGQYCYDYYDRIVSYSFVRNGNLYEYQFLLKSIDEVGKDYYTDMLEIKGDIAWVGFDENGKKHMVKIKKFVLFDNFEGISLYDLITGWFLHKNGYLVETKYKSKMNVY